MGITFIAAGIIHELDPELPILRMRTMDEIIVASLGSYLPARRASRVDPMLALRSE